MGVGKIELAINELNLCVLSGYRNVGYSDFAVMASADADGIIFFRRNQMEPTFFFCLLFVSQTLEENVRFVWLRDCHHLEVSAVRTLYAETHDLGERRFADLTLKFCEVVALNYTFDFFFDLAVYPGS